MPLNVFGASSYHSFSPKLIEIGVVYLKSYIRCMTLALPSTKYVKPIQQNTTNEFKDTWPKTRPTRIRPVFRHIAYQFFQICIPKSLRFLQIVLSSGKSITWWDQPSNVGSMSPGRSLDSPECFSVCVISPIRYVCNLKRGVSVLLRCCEYCLQGAYVLGACKYGCWGIKVSGFMLYVVQPTRSPLLQKNTFWAQCKIMHHNGALKIHSY